MTFNKAIKRIERIDKFLDSRDWNIPSNRMLEVQRKIFQLQRDAIDDEIARLERYAKECKYTIQDEVYTSPFGPKGQEHLPMSKREIQKAKTELNKITKAINDLRELWLRLMDEERALISDSAENWVVQC